ncbi:hypothetical protein SAMN05444170_6724 [Bradyrhizobium erythrophlei]|uniref:Uncharacterized protein n=2 Tax=Bradyrhizobium erythrophlei TaxID=1437360 RepID=A0A1M7UU63_9BRAD|nr:hypothetical protein SAMN05444170_6724 [Bradyrhizobium erythrophlei]
MTISATLPRPRSIGNRLGMIIAPAAALVYPLTLKSFNDAVTSVEVGHSSYLSILAAVISLMLSFAVPAAALVMSQRLGAIENPTLAQLRARRIATLSVAAPTILVFLGVLVFMAGNPVPDVALWTLFWIGALMFVLLADNERPVPSDAKPVWPAIRVAHGFSALAIVTIFLGLHLTNHMKSVRAVYRAKLIEPVLVLLLFFQVGTGLYFAMRYMAKPMDAFRAFQVASGMYLVFYVVGHMDSVFILGRTFLGIETGWDFATGAPVGLIRGARNIRLLPHYGLGVFFVLAHLSSGLRLVLLGHGVSKPIADRVMIGGAIVGALIATAIMLGMCGMRVQFV